jgi:hypothetical protein
MLRFVECRRYHLYQYVYDISKLPISPLVIYGNTSIRRLLSRWRRVVLNLRKSLIACYVNCKSDYVNKLEH